MADFTASRRTQRPGLSDAEGRKVVVQHERAIVFALQRIDALLVLCGPKGHDRQTLCLTAREQCGSMRSGEYAYFGSHRPNIGRASTISTLPLLEDHVSDFAVLEVMKDQLD